MLDAVLGQLGVAGFVLLGGIGLFLTVNKKRAVTAEGVDPTTGERTIVVRWERGTRRSRWRGYCVLGGAVLGVQLPGLLILALGTFSSRFLPDNAPPRDSDAG
jgi:hypothetical protein